MSTVVRETLGEEGWRGGAHSATDPVLVPKLSGRGRNSTLAQGDAGTPYVSKRMGLTCVNPNGLAAPTAYVGQHEFEKVSTGDRFHLLYTAAGTLLKRTTGDVITSIASGLGADVWADFVSTNEVVFFTNGRVQRKFDGTSLTKMGIDRPTVGSLAGTAGAAGDPNGTYELRVTFANSSTGHESSASNTAAATVTVTNDVIDWSNIPVSSDTQVDLVYLYVRNVATQRFFYRAGSVTNGTTTASTDFDDENLTVQAPTTISNDPPPVATKFLTYKDGRIFAATATALYYTPPLQHEAFDLTNRVETFSDGQPITGIRAFKDSLLVFKADRTYVIRGIDPDTWTIDVLDGRHGCGSHRTIIEGGLWLYWWGRHGLYRWDGLSTDVDDIGQRLYGAPDDRVFYAEVLRASACIDPTRNRLLFALPDIGQARATFILPFSLALEVFESDGWDPMDAASLGTARDAVGVSRAYLGSYIGQIFSFGTASNDGVVTGTKTGTFVAASTTVAAVSDIAAAFDTSGQGLIERKVSFFAADGTPIVSYPRPHITGNSSSIISLNKTVSGFTVGETYTYVVGGPDFWWETPEGNCGAPWFKKRFEYLFMLYKGMMSGVPAKVELRLNYHTGSADQIRSFTASTAGAEWDEAVWDTDVWDTPGTPQERWRVADVGFAWKARVRNGNADQPFGMFYIGVQAVYQSTKR